MKYLIILLTFYISVFAIEIDDRLLKIHATLLPKIYLMDYKYKEKINNNSIVISILYDDVNYKSAISIQNKILKKYGDGIKSHKLEVNIMPYAKIDNAKANIYYLLPSDKSNIEKTIEHACKDEALTFAYLKDDLQYGVMISLNIGKKVKPLLNLNAIKSYNISFRPVLLNISSVYSGSNSSILEKLKIKGSIFTKNHIEMIA